MRNRQPPACARRAPNLGITFLFGPPPKCSTATGPQPSESLGPRRLSPVTSNEVVIATKVFGNTFDPRTSNQLPARTPPPATNPPKPAAETPACGAGAPNRIVTCTTCTRSATWPIPRKPEDVSAR